MRIALVITELHPGGAEKCCVNLACHLKHLEHEVRVWQLWPEPPEQQRVLTDQLDAHQILWSSLGASRAWHFPQAVNHLRRELKLFEPDVAQAFLFHANVALGAASVGLPMRVFGGVRVSQPQPWRWRLQNWASKRMEKVICVSASVAIHCREKEKIPAEKIIVIPNGIEAATSLSRHDLTLELPPDARLLVFVGRLTDQKGILELVRSSDRLLRELPSHHLVLIGDGELRSKLQTEIQRSHYSSRLHLVGWQPCPRNWMKSADLLLLPARYEGMPNVVLEAMSEGRAVVAFDVDGIQELLGDDPEVKQQIAPRENFEAFVAQTIRLSENESLRSACGEKNRQRVNEHFTLERQLQRYTDLYLHLPR